MLVGRNRTKENYVRESTKMEHNFAVKAFWVFHDFPSLSLIVIFLVLYKRIGKIHSKKLKMSSRQLE